MRKITVICFLALAACGTEDAPTNTNEPVSCFVPDSCVADVVAEFCNEPTPAPEPAPEPAPYDDGTCDAKPVTDNECFRFQYVEFDGELRWTKVRYNCPVPR